MGYLTPVLLYKDSMHEFVKDPLINERIYEAANEAERSEDWGHPADAFYQSFRPTFFDKILAFFGLKKIKPNLRQGWGSGSCALVLRSQHADVDRVLIVTGNGIMDLSDVIFHQEKLSEYEQHGVKVVKDLISYYNWSQRVAKKE